MNVSEDQPRNPSKLMSAMSAITSLASSLMPDGLTWSQLQHLIASLVQLQTSAPRPDRTDPNEVADDQPTDASHASNRRERHRQTERVRHNTIIALIRQLGQLTGLKERHESQAAVLSRSARYVLFLSHVIDKLVADSADDSIQLLSDQWLQSLYPLYQRAYEEATSLLQTCSEANSVCGSELSQPSVDSCLSCVSLSRDQCIRLN